MSDPREMNLAQIRSVDELASAAETCTGCELYEDATRVVFGEGPTSASMMLLGEQPGDREDIEGKPFVGPAGRELDRALEEAEIERSEVYVTNVVKHFRFEERGKQRLHKKPTRRHAEACRPWLEAELQRVEPEVIVCLGSSAAQSLLGSHVRVMEDHGVPSDWEGYMVVPTIHPAFVLRSVEAGRRSELFALLVADLRAAAHLRGGG